MKKTERFAIILEELKNNKTIQVKQLSERFNVSMETIRRDLEELEQGDYLKRVYGGAVLLKKNIPSQNFIERKNYHLKEKRLIAKKCVSLVKEGDFVAFDASTTNATITQEFMSHFKHLTVLTNDIYNAQQIAINTNWTVLLPGGEINNHELFISGASAITYINKFQIDKYFMSISGFSEEIGFTDYGFKECEIKMALFQNANQVYIAADHHKFGQQAMIKVCKANEIDGVITDPDIDAETVAYFREHKYPLYF